MFWNKEDPVHYERFVGTATLCDHVFTTDGAMVPRYLAAGVGTLRSASSLPFYAQPRIHNPLPGRRPYEHTVAYAGTFYGDRYPQRSAELSSLLEAAAPFGLAIYDRQAAIPDSPYHFPPSLQPAVRGALPYDEVIDSYKAHVANLNVNSVTGSPTMFSRRVVEVAACGGVVLSGPGRGITETLGSAVPALSDPLTWRALLRAWSTDPQARLAEAWLQMRTVLRAHTVDTALTLVARTAGLPVLGPDRPTWAAVVSTTDPVTLRTLAAQSVPPSQVVCLAADGREAAEVATTVRAALGRRRSRWWASSPTAWPMSSSPTGSATSPPHWPGRGPRTSSTRSRSGRGSGSTRSPTPAWLRGFPSPNPGPRSADARGWCGTTSSDRAAASRRPSTPRTFALWCSGCPWLPPPRRPRASATPEAPSRGRPTPATRHLGASTGCACSSPATT